MSHATSAPLAGWYVISLRPQARHAPVRRAASARGASVFALSTLKLEPLDAGAALRDALMAPVVIVTSPAAAAFAAAQARLRVRRDQSWLAVGPGTAAALRRAGVAEVSTPGTGSTSEGVLAMPALRALHDTDVGLITAPGGRDLLAPALRRRGARVHKATVYRRVPVTPTRRRLDALAALPPERLALLVSSGEALAGLWRALDDAARQGLRQCPCVVSSDRLDAEAKALGFQRRLRADSTRPGTMLEALARHVGATRPRRFR